MKILFTQETKKHIKKCYNNFNGIATINTISIKEEIERTHGTDDKYTIFLINQEISNLLLTYNKSKRFHTILYIVDVLSKDIILSIKDFFKQHDIYITDYIIIECFKTIDSSLLEYVDNAV